MDKINILASKGDFVLYFRGQIKKCTSEKCSKSTCRNEWQGRYIVQKVSTFLQYELILEEGGFATSRFLESLESVSIFEDIPTEMPEDISYLGSQRWRFTLDLDPKL